MKNYSITCQNLSKRYRIGSALDPTLRGSLKSLVKVGQSTKEFLALSDVSFEVEQGEAIGIIGRNGSGKSTLLKILSRITYPTSGSAILNGRVASLLEVGTGFHPELTGRENIYLNGSLLGMNKKEISRSIDEIVDFSGVEQFLDTPVKRYSSGMYVRLAFSIAAHLRTDILLIDEVLSVGDFSFQKKCLSKMDASIKDGKTVLLVSHDLKVIRDLCNSSILIEEGRVKGIDKTDQVISQYLSADYTSSKVYSDHTNVQEVRIVQEPDLCLEVDYEVKDKEIPHFGFVVSNQFGEKIFGANPDLLFEDIRAYAKRGTIRVSIKEPKLLKGSYYLSVWFYNGTTHTLIDENCIRFQVTDNSKFSEIGYLLPKVSYQYF